MTGLNIMDKKVIGKIIDDYRCCDMSLDIYDQNSIAKFKIVGGCCQCAMMCKKYETCYEICYYIYPSKCQSENPKNSVGKIVRQKKEYTKSIFTDADNFEIYFPETATAYDKLMIIGATLMLDYTYFEESPVDPNVEENKKKIPRAAYNQ